VIEPIGLKEREALRERLLEGTQKHVPMETALRLLAEIDACGPKLEKARQERDEAKRLRRDADQAREVMLYNMERVMEECNRAVEAFNILRDSACRFFDRGVEAGIFDPDTEHLDGVNAMVDPRFGRESLPSEARSNEKMVEKMQEIRRHVDPSEMLDVDGIEEEKRKRR
jgi:hypothetical protein